VARGATHDGRRSSRRGLGRSPARVATTDHDPSRAGGNLLEALKAAADARGWLRFYETSVYGPSSARKNYRVPDLLVVAPEHVAERGIEARAELVIELLSPDDESRDKLPFYAQCGIPEVWLIEPETRVPRSTSCAGPRTSPWRPTHAACCTHRHSASSSPSSPARSCASPGRRQRGDLARRGSDARGRLAGTGATTATGSSPPTPTLVGSRCSRPCLRRR